MSFIRKGISLPGNIPPEVYELVRELCPGHRQCDRGRRLSSASREIEQNDLMKNEAKTRGRRDHPVAHKVVSEKTWLSRRKELLKKEKAFTRQRDEVSRQRRALPWVMVEKSYTFGTPLGRRSLADLFEGIPVYPSRSRH